MVSSHLKMGKAEDSSEDELHLVDAVLAAFCFQSEREKLPPHLSVQAVYRAFAELRRKYPAWFQDLSFSYGPADTVPISGILEDILFDLGASGIMSVSNPWYKNLSISKSKLEIMRQAISKRRNETEQGELKSLADDFDQLYSTAIKKE